MEQNGETYDIDGDIDTGTAGECGTETPATEPTPAQSRAPGVKVDLAAWGRGERDYLLYEIREAIDDRIFEELYELVAARRGIVRDRRAAVEWLVEEGIISADEARTDV